MYEKVPKWKEECGIYGVYSPTEDVSEMTYLGLFALQHRGQESAGIALTDGDWIDVKKGMGLVSEVFREQLPRLDNAKIAIGHVRYATTGFSLAANAQPLRVNYAGGALALAHNGDLTNAALIRRDLESKGTVFQTTIDTEVFVHLIARSQKPSVEERILEAVSVVRGAFCLSIMTEDKLIGVRDPQGFRPLCIGRTPDGGWVLSSETCALDVNGAEFVRDVLPGEMVVMDSDGLKSYRFSNGKDVASCIFEYIYFARPDSIIDGQSVHAARFEMGRVLARESGFRGDVVISVPDSGTTAATGFSYEAGIPFAEGLIKNRYIGRTFIQPTQKQRDSAVKLKLSPVRSVVASYASCGMPERVRSMYASAVHPLRTPVTTESIHLSARNSSQQPRVSMKSVLLSEQILCILSRLMGCGSVFPHSIRIICVMHASIINTRFPKRMPSSTKTIRLFWNGGRLHSVKGSSENRWRK